MRSRRDADECARLWGPERNKPAPPSELDDAVLAFMKKGGRVTVLDGAGNEIGTITGWSCEDEASAPAEPAPADQPLAVPLVTLVDEEKISRARGRLLSPKPTAAPVPDVGQELAAIRKRLPCLSESLSRLERWLRS